MRSFFISAFVITLIASCGQSANSPAPTTNLAGFLTEKIAGTDAEIVVQKDAGGVIKESGIVRNGVKDGIYMTYTPEGKIKTLGSYVNGKLNGVYLEMSDREQVELKAHYKNDLLHGPWASYRYGRPTKELNYNENVLDGPYSEWSDRGKLSKKGAFKNGKQDGLLQFFDEEEKLMMEYTYKDGEKVSGGIVEQE